MTLNEPKLKVRRVTLSHAEAACATMKAMSKLAAIDLH
jgi:hypothetical protein